MKVTPSIIEQEFIGLEAKVTKSSNLSNIGIAGTIINETRNTLIILQDNRKKTVVKNQAIFHFTFPDTSIVEIDGKILTGRPEDRLKKRVRRFW